MRAVGLRLLGALGVLALLALLAGVPLVLVAIGANPIPNSLPTGQQVWDALSSPDDGHLLLLVFAVLAWAAWLFLAVAVLVEIASRLRGVSAPRLPGLTLPQGAARGLVSVAALLFTTLPITTQLATAAPPPPPISAAAPHTTQTSRPTVATEAANTKQVERTAPKQQRTITHTVQPGETLWSIAEQHLGDGAQYKKIADLNYQHRQPDGSKLTNNHWIQAGWQLKVPVPDKPTADQDSPAEDESSYTVKPGDTLWELADDKLGDGDRYGKIVQASRNLEQPGGARLTDPDEIRPGWHLQIPAQDVDSDAKANPRPEPSTDRPEPSNDRPTESAPPRDQPHRPSQQPTTAPPISTPSATATQQPTQPTATQQPVQPTAPPQTAAPEQASDDTEDWVIRSAGGVGAVLAAGVLGLVVTRRRAQQRRRGLGKTLPMPAPAAAAVEHDLRVTADPLSVQTVDVALRTLARSCAEAGTPLPVVRAARLTADQFDLYLAEPVELPAPWSGTADTTVWSIDAADTFPSDLTGVPAPYPALVTIGHDLEAGHVFLDLEYLGVLHIAGDPQRTQEVIAAVTVELAMSQWADDLQVTVVGAYPELEDALQTGRIRYLPSVGHVLDELTHRANQDRAALAADQAADLQQARVIGAAPDAWSPEIVILAGPITTRQRNQLETLTDQLPRVAIAALTTDTQVGEWALQLTEGDDLAVLSPIGLQLRPQRIDEAAYSGILDMITATEVNPEPATTEQIDPEPTLADLGKLPAAPDDDATPDELDAQLQRPDAQEREPRRAVVEPDLVEAPTDTPPTPLIQVLGPVNLLHAGGRVEDTKRNRLLELAAYLALNPGAAHTAIDDAIWPNRKSNDNLNTRNTATSKLRSWLGKTSDGEDYLPRHQSGGGAGYRFLPAVRCDWGLWTELLPGGPMRAATEHLEQALQLVHGRPFDGAHPRRYAWAEPIRQRMISEIVDASYELARRRLMQGRWRAVEQAVVIGLALEPALERLWRLRILAAHESRNTAATKEAIDRLLAVTDELGGDLEPETENLLEAVLDPNRELDSVMAGAL